MQTQMIVSLMYKEYKNKNLHFFCFLGGWDIYNAKNKLDQAAVKTNSVIGEYTMEKINGFVYI